MRLHLRSSWKLWRLARSGAFGPNLNGPTSEAASFAENLATRDEDDALLAERLRPVLERRGVQHSALVAALDPESPRGEDPVILRRALRLVQLATAEVRE